MKVNGCWHWIKRIEIEFWPPPTLSTLLIWKSYIQTPKYENLRFSKIKSMFYGPPLGCEQLVSRKFISQSRLHIFFSLVWLGVTFQFWKFTRVLYIGTCMFRCSIERIMRQFKKKKHKEHAEKGNTKKTSSMTVTSLARIRPDWLVCWLFSNWCNRKGGTGSLNQDFGCFSESNSYINTSTMPEWNFWWKR